MEDGINEFTLDCDRFLLHPEYEFMRTYLSDMGNVLRIGNKGYIAFRVPGATRGNIVVNAANKIIDVIFFYDMCFEGMAKCYDKAIIGYIRSKYIGAEFVQEDVLERTSTNYKALQNKLLERA